MERKAAPARRTSSAPAGRNGAERPLPKASAASASARIGRTWLRRKTMATAVRRIEARIIKTRSWCGFETESRSRGMVASRTPARVCIRMTAPCESERSIARGGGIEARKVSATLAPVRSKTSRVTPGSTVAPGSKPSPSSSGRASWATRAAASTGSLAVSISSTA